MLEIVADYAKVPARIRKSIRGLSKEDLDLRGGDENWAIRETVHHIVEANLIASNMIIAALAADGYAYDWTWVWPSRAWMRRIGYDKAAIEPALKMLGGLCAHIAELVTTKSMLARKIQVNNKPGAPRYPMTVEKILRDQVEHAEGHLAEIRKTREKHSR